MNEAEIRRIVHQVLQDERERANDNFDEVVLKTISTILTSFGINDDEKKEIRDDFNHLRRWRKASEQVYRVSFGSAVVIIITGALGMFWMGFKLLVGRP